MLPQIGGRMGWQWTRVFVCVFVHNDLLSMWCSLGKWICNEILSSDASKAGMKKGEHSHVGKYHLIKKWRVQHLLKQFIIAIHNRHKK